MDIKVDHFLWIAPVVVLGAACSSDGPCLEGGGDGECAAGETKGSDPVEGCAPFEDDEIESGMTFTCQGEGAGWLTTKIYGAGSNNPLTGCLAYVDPENIPTFPSPEDCAPIPFEQIPFGIAPPSACCGEDTQELNIVTTCNLDCGYAACKAAVEAMRDSADNMVAQDGIPQGVVDTTKTDLYAFADLLESPLSLQYCANKVAQNPGGVVPIGLDEGVTSPAAFGHIKEATLHLGCALDPDEPYVAEANAGVCEDATNIPEAMQQQQQGGTITSGAITATGPGIDTLAAITNASFEVHEVLKRDLCVDFTLTSFQATVADTSAGSFAFRDPHLSLVGPAAGKLEGEIVTFAPGTLRFALTARIQHDGEPLFGDLPLTSEYANTQPATAIRSVGSSFAFLDATFEVGEVAVVLNTEPAELEPRQ